MSGFSPLLAKYTAFWCVFNHKSFRTSDHSVTPRQKTRAIPIMRKTIKIAISGTGGIGKTSLARALAEEFGVPLIEEGLNTVVTAINDLDHLRKTSKQTELIKKAENNYIHVCEQWLNHRQNIQNQYLDGYILDRWALDLFQRWLYAGIRQSNNTSTHAWISHIRTQAEQFDLIIIPPFNTSDIEQKNESGLYRKQAIAPRLLSHALYRGLLDELVPTPKLYIPSSLETLESRVELVIDEIENLRNNRIK